MSDPTDNDEDVYYELIIEAEARATEIWLGDDQGHLVQKETGLLHTRLLPGHYRVELGLGSTMYPIDLIETSRYTETELRAGPSCPRPKCSEYLP
jgi:hypothetical protein